MKICTVLVTNNNYFERMLYTLNGILQNGYHDDICIVIGNDLIDSNKLTHPLLQNKNIIIKHFADIIFSDNFIQNFNTIERDSHWKNKIFQYHKFYLFDIYFKRWDYIFYIDAGTHVYSSIYPIIDSRKPYKFLAHSDAYPTYIWKLHVQFTEHALLQDLKDSYNLNIDYPQTTIMLYDTEIIKNDTFTNLLSLAEKYPISRTNDQGIIALYFTNIVQLWEQIKLEDENIWYYDYLRRPEKTNKPHILLKT